MEAVRMYFEHQQPVEASVMTVGVGDICCAFDSHDQCWYRAKVLRVSECHSGSSEDSKFQVCCVDYGTTKQIQGRHLYSIPKEFCILPSQALILSIVDSPVFHQSLSQNNYGSIVGLQITSTDAPNSFVGRVHITLDPLHCDNMLELKSSCVPFRLVLPDVQFPFKAVVAHLNDVTDFYVHQLEKASVNELKDLENEMQYYYSDKSNRCVRDINTENQGQVACIYSSVCQHYSRAVILGTNSTECEVQLVDYGHTETIGLRGILELPLRFLFFPVFSIHCRLAVFEDGDYVADYTSLFEEMVSTMDVLTVVQGKKETVPCTNWNDFFYVDLYGVNGEMDVRVSQHLRNLTSKSGEREWDPMQADYLSAKNHYSVVGEDKRPPPHGTVYSYVHPSQKRCPAFQLDLLLQGMREYYSHQVFKEDFHFVLDGDVVAACKDDFWFRAEVLQCTKQRVLVFNVDFGDVSSVLPSDIRLLKEQFLVLPFQAVQCFTAGSSSTTNTREFVDQIRDHVVVAEVAARYNQGLKLQLHSQHSCSSFTSLQCLSTNNMCHPG
jgi:hypothetical protein